MPRDLHLADLGSMPRSHDARERVSSGRTRMPLVPTRFRLIAILLAGFPVLVWSRSSQPLSWSPDRLSLVGHTLLVQAVAFAPDGRTLASCGNDRTVRLWDTAHWGDGSTARSDVLMHDSPVVAMAYSPDGHTMVTAMVGSLAIWSGDPASGRVVERPGETFRSLAYSPDGRTLAVGGDDGTIRLWDMPEARERAALCNSDGPVNCLAFSPDGKILASGSPDGRVVLRDGMGGALLRVLREGKSKPIRCVAFSPDGRTLGVADPVGAGDALLLDVETAAIRTRLRGEPLGIVSLAFSPDGRIAATAGIDRSIRLWDLARSTQLAEILDGRVLKSVAFSPDGRWLACASGEDVTLLDMSQPPTGRTVLPRSVAKDRRSADLAN